MLPFTSVSWRAVHISRCLHCVWLGVCSGVVVLTFFVFLRHFLKCGGLQCTSAQQLSGPWKIKIIDHKMQEVCLSGCPSHLRVCSRFELTLSLSSQPWVSANQAWTSTMRLWWYQKYHLHHHDDHHHDYCSHHHRHDNWDRSDDHGAHL